MPYILFMIIFLLIGFGHFAPEIQGVLFFSMLIFFMVTLFTDKKIRQKFKALDKMQLYIFGASIAVSLIVFLVVVFKTLL